jgi:hypothetical protein
LDRAPEKIATGKSPDSTDRDKRRQFQEMESTVSQESLWVWQGDSSGTEEGERPPLKTGTRGLMRDSRPIGLSACVMNCGL